MWFVKREGSFVQRRQELTVGVIGMLPQWIAQPFVHRFGVHQDLRYGIDVARIAIVLESIRVRNFISIGSGGL